jgi:hypothetical protein
MATPAWAEARLALTGALRLARGDARGLACFDPSEAGFWHSFRAAVLCYPLYLILLSFPIEIGTPRRRSTARLFARRDHPLRDLVGRLPALDAAAGRLVAAQRPVFRLHGRL